jgi:hypothetical protein
LKELKLLVRAPIGHPDALEQLFGWRPQYRSDRFGSQASMSSSSAGSEIRSITVMQAQHNDHIDRGVISLFLNAEAYCVRLDDAVAVFGSPRISAEAPRHFQSRTRFSNVYSAAFPLDQESTVTLTLRYQECTQSIHITKNLPK